MKKLGAAYIRKAARTDKHVKKSLDSLKHAKSTSVTEMDFRQFIKLVMPNYVFYRWNEILIDLLEEVVAGKLLRLVVQVPPRHGKSQLVSRLFPAYYLLKHQDRQVALTSYGATLAEGFSRAARAFYVDAGGKLDPASQSVKAWGTEQNGGLWAVGVGGAATGRGAHLGIVDDPIKDRKEAESNAVIGTLRDWYGSTFRTRIEPEGGAIVIVQTRWSENDLVGQVLDNEAEVDAQDREGWHVVDFPAIAEEWSDRPPLPDCVTVEEDWREPGEALCPQRYDMRALSKIRAAVGSREFASLYQQSPRAAGGNIIDPNWFQYYSAAPEKFSRIIMSADCTFTASDTSDYVAIAIIGETGGRYYLLDMVNERMDIIGTMARMQAKVRQWAPSAVLVEAAANGHAVMQMMKQKIPNMIGIKPAQGGSKTTRVQAVAPIIEAGNFYLPQRATWVEPFVSQCALFPASKNDDMIDSVSQALNWSTRRPEFKSTTATYGYGARPKVAGPKIDGFE
jgi:predicted phage terminase large subunit-like protein